MSDGPGPDRHRAFLGLGSNLGDRVTLLREAVAALPDVDAVSGVYETDPVGGVEQGAFLNVVVRLSTRLGGRELLEVGQACEREADRVRLVRWGPRTLDVDVLAVGHEVINEDDLVVPHPLIAERGFVLHPWAEVDAEFDIPGLGKVGELAGRLSRDGVRRTDEYLLLPG